MLTKAGLVAGLYLLAPAAAWGQLATVQGSVRDDQGGGVYGAFVQLFSGESRGAATGTDELGSFRLLGIAPGPYTLVVAALGYADLTREVDLQAGMTLELELRLERRAIELEGISVEAERSRDRVRFEEIVGATVREMDIGDLRAVPGVAEPDPVRAIEVLPGVVSTSDFSASFHVRGGSADQNLILLDGVPIFSPFHLGGLFSVFNADMIDRVELQSGGFAAEHGGRVSSVLQVESDAGDGTFGVDGGISLLASRVAIQGGVPQGVADALGHANVHYRVSARRSYFDVLLKPVFEFPYHLTDVQAVVEGWTKSGGRLTLTAYSGKDVLDLTRFDPEDFPLRIDWDWGNDLVGLRWMQPRRGGGSWDVRANVTRYGTALSFPDFADTEFSSRVRQGQFRADLDTRPSPGLTLKTGLSFEALSYRNLFRSGGTDFASGEGTGNLLGAYGQGTWSHPRSWLLEAGLRLDSWHPDPGSAVAEWSPRLAVKRFFSGGDVAVKAAAGRYTQFLHSVRDEELPIGLDVWVLSGDRAPHVRSDQVQVGVEGYRGTDWFWSVEGYSRSFDGVVTLNAADDPNDDLDNFLPGAGRSYGVDLFVRKERGDVSGWIAVSLLKAERTFPDPISPLDPPPDATYPPIFDKTVDVDFVLRYPAPWGWEGGVRWNAGSGVPYTRALGAYTFYSPRWVDDGGRLRGESDSAVLLEGRNQSRYPAYHRLDVSFRKTLQKSWGTMTPYVNVVNLYNRRNVLFYFFEYDQSPPVRNGISMFPALPTFGLEIRF